MRKNQEVKLIGQVDKNIQKKKLIKKSIDKISKTKVKLMITKIM